MLPQDVERRTARFTGGSDRHRRVGRSATTETGAPDDSFADDSSGALPSRVERAANDIATLARRQSQIRGESRAVRRGDGEMVDHVDC